MSRQGRYDEALARRREGAAYLLAGHTGDRLTQRQIADRLKVSVGTINRDIKLLREQWRQENIEAIDAVMVDDLRRIQVALNAIWTQVLGGELQATDRMVKLIETRAKILGYSAPAKIDVTSGGDKVSPITVIEVVRPDED